METRLKHLVKIIFLITMLTSCSRKYNMALIRNTDSKPNVAALSFKDSKSSTWKQQELDTTTEQVVEDPLSKTENNLVADNEVSLQNIVKKPNYLRKTIASTQSEERPIVRNFAAVDKLSLKNKTAWKNNYAAKTTKINHNWLTTTINSKLLLVIIAIFIPPLAVSLYQERLTLDFLICLLLTFLFWLPGVIYAICIILK